MKKIVIFLIVFNASFLLNAQIDYILSNANKNNVKIYEVQNSEDYKIYMINSVFAKQDLNYNEQELQELKKEEIIRVDYVYTKYKLTDTFNQKRLNKQRLENLYEIFPDLFEYNLIKWNFYSQNDYDKLAEAKKAFHGFVFYCKKFDKEKALEKRKKELDSLKEIVEEFEPDTSFRYKYNTEKYTMYLPRLKWKRKKGILYRKKSVWRRKPILIVDTISIDTVVSIGEHTLYLEDTAVLHLLNKHKDWDYDNAVVVMDVTGSMFPYTAQILLWAKKFYAKNKKLRFVFFNDGDDHPDGPVGRSYGYYSVARDQLEAILDTLYYTMGKGCGGKGPENDIEAILYAQKRFPEAEFIILIADNNAPVRDLRLMKKINKPVKVVLCGTDYGINAQYLTLAYHTEGAVYTIKEDIENLNKYKNGNILKLKDEEFILRNGNFYEN